MKKAFLFLNLMKSSAAAAEKAGKWYDKHLQQGARWVTIKDEHSPLHGRHILIDGHGFIIGGKGIPKKVVDKLNGGHIDLLGGYENTARKDAVAQESAKLGKTVMEDSKGTWTMDHVGRSYYSNDVKTRDHYNVSVQFKPKPGAGLKASQWGENGTLYLSDQSDKDHLKRMIKAKVGYTPSNDVINAFYDHFSKLRGAIKEEDNHFANGNKEAAQKTLDDLHNKAMENYKKGDMAGLDDYYKKNPHKATHANRMYQRYLTPEDQKKARDAQKYVNGHSWEAREDINFSGHLDPFNKRLEQSKRAYDFEQERKKEEELKNHLNDLAEKDPAFRRLLNHYIQADKTRKGDVEHELMHRLFGYTNNFEDYRDMLNNKYWPLLKKFGMGHFDLKHHFPELAKKYEGTLPPVHAPSERKKGAFHYGDYIKTPGGNMETLEKVGSQYVYDKHGNKYKKDLVSHWYDDPEEPQPAPTPEPPKEEPKPAEPKGKGKKEKAPKTGYGDQATMHVTGNTFPHLKQLKHVHGGKWNGEYQRWEFNHAHGSEGHQKLQDYAKTNGLTLTHLGEGTPAPEPPKEAPKPEGPSNEGGKKGKVTFGGNTYSHKYALKTEHGAKWNKDAKQWEVHDVAHGSDKHKALQKFAEERGITATHEHDGKAPAPAPKPEPKPEPPKPQPKPEPKPDPPQAPKAPQEPKAPKKEEPKSGKDIRNDAQEGRNVAYDVGEKVGGARKDTYVASFNQSPTPQNLERLEKEAPELAQLYAKKKHILTPEKEQFERDNNNGVELSASVLKNLVYKRISPEPVASTPEARMRYVTAIHELRRVLEPIKTFEDMRNAIRDLSDRGRASTIRYKTDAERAIAFANSELAKPNVSDFSRENAEKILSSYPQKLEKHKENYLSFPVEALGEKAANFFTDYESRNRTMDTARKKTHGMTWETFGISTKTPKETTKKPRGSERAKWERATVSEHLRTGGRETNVEKPEHMLKAFGMRGVEFGNWVDDASGKYHLKRSAEAFHDLADIIGAEDKHMSFNGKLAMAFGARGKGGALAHYEPAKKVINMTKYGGAGSLAHEWGHGMDNIMAQYANGGRAGLDMASTGQMGSHDPELKAHYDALMNAIHNGVPGGKMGGVRKIQLNTADPKNQFGTYYRNMRKDIQGGMSFEDAYKKYAESFNRDYDNQISSIKNNSYFERNYGNDADAYRKKEMDKVERKRKKEMKELPHRIAQEMRYNSPEYKGAGWDKKGKSGHIIKDVAIPTGKSEYYTRMQEMDGNGKAYYSQPEEMFARVFESYIEDKMAKAGRKNNYLVHGTTENHVKHDGAPFPYGEERQHMFKLMDNLVNHIVKKGALEKALKLMVLGRPKLYIAL